MRNKGISFDQKKTENHISESRTSLEKQIPKPVEMIHRTKNNTEKQIIIDLDDAYGVPFSSSSFHIQEQ